jgi:NAD(P)-dependent dehydrogenase (short-subunit alcohol dehydrogenase family)
MTAALVTGTSSGIGLACAVRLAESGFHVFAGVRQERDIRALNGLELERLIPIVLDVTDPTSIAGAVRIVTSTVGQKGLYALINNAGIVVPGSLEFLHLDQIRQQFEVNVFGHIAVTQAFLPLLRLGRGRIVNMGSTGGRIAMPFIGPYNASKFAMEAFTDSLRLELRPWNIPVSIIEPSFVATPLWGKTAARADDIRRNFPQEAELLYGTIFSKVRKAYVNVGNSASSADTVAKLVVHVATVKKPKARYVVGKGAKLQTGVFAHLPQRVRDFLIAGFIKRQKP